MAARLRTLPLAISGILVGQVCAWYINEPFPFRFPVLWLALLTAVLLQVLSNYANDYGDFLKGADHAGRVGSTRALASGAITPNAMRTALIVVSLLSLVSGITLLLVSFGTTWSTPWLVFLLWGVVAIGAAITYTSGRFAYGYRRLGDLGVFLFFGLTAVIGGGYLQHPGSVTELTLPAIWLGALATAVLNVNNIRDMESDQQAQKWTLALWLGLKGARRYHLMLLVLAFVAFWIQAMQWFDFWWQYSALLPWFLLMRHGIHVNYTPPGAAYNGFLKGLALTTFLLSVWFCAVILLAHA